MKHFAATLATLSGLGIAPAAVAAVTICQSPNCAAWDETSS